MTSISNQGQTEFESVPDVCSQHGRSLTKICTVCNSFLCPQCETEHPYREHVFKSLAFVAEEISESLRVKLVPHERTFESFSAIMKELQEKFKKSNLKT